MDTARIANAAKEIDKCQRALEWFEQYRDKVTTAGTKVDIRMDYAGSCYGADDATLIIEQMVANRIHSILSDAVDNCRNTIELHRQVIRAEAES